MFARVSTYGIAIAALLMTACSQNETELKTVPTEKPVAISFSFTSTQDNQATTRSEFTDTKLRSTGFGVFATVEGSEIPNLMYNQQVTYTYLADDNYQLDGQAQNGYWSYSPTKYWPIQTVEENGDLKTVPQTVTFCAYAPYAEPADLVGATTGITGVSDNEEKPYLDYTLSEDLDETVDLLWTCYQPTELGPIEFKMYHALARVAVNVMVDNTNEYKTSDDWKVLISQITLSTSTAVKTGRLKLDNTESNDAVTNHYPIWTGTDPEHPENLEYTTRTVEIQNTDNSKSYGIIAEDVRYIDDLPFSWQPKGVEKGVASNALCTGDYPQAYIYFIPNEAGLTLDCTVKYRLMNSATGYTSPELSTTATNVPVPSKDNPNDPDEPLKPLRGNRTYLLKLIINPKVPTTP